MPTTIQDIQNALIKRKKPPNRLFQVPGTPEVYELSEWQAPTAEKPGGYGTKRWISSPEAFETEYGKEGWAKVKPISQEELGKYSMTGQAPPGYETKPKVEPEPKPEVEAVIEPVEPSLGVEVGAEPLIKDYSKIWEDKYSESGLEDVKIKTAEKDTEISDRKKQRDQMLLDEKGKPIPQWMITGRKKLEIEAATNDLNRIIDERNAMAGQYNTGIASLEKKVGYAIDYQKELQRQLGEEVEAERWEKEYALDVEEAREPKTSSITYESGGRLYLRTYNAETGETIKTEDLGPAPAGGGGYTPTQLRAVDREKNLLNDVIRIYKEDWPEKGDEGLGTREALITRAIKEFSSLTPDMIRDAVYGQVTNEWLEEKRAGKKKGIGGWLKEAGKFIVSPWTGFPSPK